MNHPIILVAFLVVTFTLEVLCAPPTLEEALTALRAVGPEGQGNAEASLAWPRIAAAEPAELLQILQAMDQSSPLALNWLRSGFDAAAQRTLDQGQALPQSRLESFALDTSGHPRARWLALDWVRRLDPLRAETLLGSLLNDPGPELRRAAVDQLVRRAVQQEANKQPDRARSTYSMALQSARDPDQIETLASALRDLGVSVNLPELFGWVTHWRVIGPFDNANRAGFNTVYPPEKELDFKAEYAGKTEPVHWQPHSAAGEYGLLDFNPALGTFKEVVGYATTDFIATTARPAEIRLGCKNAWKLWFNGHFVFGRDEYHRAREIDQYRFPVQLRAGRNTLLLKICQNEQVEDWTKEWEFQLRITDRQGKPILAHHPAGSETTNEPK
jgi:hypothetical protein